MKTGKSKPGNVQPKRAHVGNASDPEQVKRAKDTDRARRDREIRDQYELLSTRAGRAEYWRWLGECGVFRSSIDESATWTAYNEGRRSIGLEMLAEVTSRWPDLYLLMQQEATQAAASTDSTMGEQKTPDTTEEENP